MNSNKPGTFVISLDFELFWGVWDVTTKEKYGPNIIGVKKAMPLMLQLFEEYGINITFATVGFLFAKDKKELLDYLPGEKPGYSNLGYNVYEKELPSAGNNEKDDPYHFGYPILQSILKTNHEIGTHTFSHYYCLEEGQTAVQFTSDILAAKKIATANNILLQSIVFPRNQVNEVYLPILYANGISVYRGNPTSWIYKPRQFLAEIPIIRLCRLLDTYLPISGYNTHKIQQQSDGPTNVPASRFLKPYKPGLAWLEKLKLKRIKNEMTKAAQKGELYHLWWHPHNFGIYTDKNIDNLRTILKHFLFLKNKYGFVNHTMKEAADN
jgi:peptidoglycan/xylan/chitin deacetylase (PgdA/CDA1 family)